MRTDEYLNLEKAQDALSVALRDRNVLQKSRSDLLDMPFLLDYVLQEEFKSSGFTDTTCKWQQARLTENTLLQQSSFPCPPVLCVRARFLQLTSTQVGGTFIDDVGA